MVRHPSAFPGLDSTAQAVTCFYYLPVKRTPTLTGPAQASLFILYSFHTVVRKGLRPKQKSGGTCSKTGKKKSVKH